MFHIYINTEETVISVYENIAVHWEASNLTAWKRIQMLKH
jgi:hypothetical protein